MKMDCDSIKSLLDLFRSRVDAELDKIITAIKSPKEDSISEAHYLPSYITPLSKNNSLSITLINSKCEDASISVNPCDNPIESKRSKMIIRNSTPNGSTQEMEKVIGDANSLPSPVANIPKPKYVNVPFDDYTPIQPSFIYSTRNMFIHFDYDKVEQFSIDVNERYKEDIEGGKLSPLQPMQVTINMLYCVFNQNDGNYYRAQIIEKKDAEKFRVLLVDFGEYTIVDSSKIFPLFSKFSNVPIYAINCFLADEWKKPTKYVENFMVNFFSRDDTRKTEIKAKFFRPLYGKYPVSLILRFPGEEWSDIFKYVDMKFNNLPLYEQVNKLIFNFHDFQKSFPLEYSANTLKAYDQFLKTSISKTNLILYRAYSSFSPYVFNSSNFIMVVNSFDNEPDVCDSDYFTTNMSYFYRNSNFDHLSGIQPGILVAFKLGDTFFFRGFVLSCSSPFVTLLSLDYGFTAQLSETETFPLLETFALEKYPMFSLVCSLEGVHPKDEATSTELFRNLVNGQRLDVKPVTIYYTRGQYTVKLYLDGLEINEALQSI